MLGVFATLAIVAVLAFMLFAPSKYVEKTMAAIGGFLQMIFVKIRGLFSK